MLPDARAFQHVIVLTHVPPFRDACWHEGQSRTTTGCRIFTCKAVGDALSRGHDRRPRSPDDRALRPHARLGEAQILPNLRVLTGGAEYGKPACSG